MRKHDICRGMNNVYFTNHYTTVDLIQCIYHVVVLIDIPTLCAFYAIYIVPTMLVLLY